MENHKLERIKNIADKTLTYNRDINQHIESCKISMKIIKEKDDEIDILRTMLIKRDEEIRKLEENNLKLRAKRNAESNEFREVIKEQYKIIRDLSNTNKNIK